MSDVVIKAEGLGKSYMIGHQQKESYTTLRDTLANGAKHWWSRLRNPHYHTHENMEEFWALRDINFEIKQGDRVGIIGRNGAGKSTLLKVLSRITEPTTGRVKIAGRVASLLEVGTGFHPELTGRENIFLNGAILGMTRSDIKKKFDEIVAFAEVEKFLDTPVKRYSSGMYVRLAFAVAAHLEPEILVVDEVLAVGDAQFQKKCLGKMGEVGREGRTVLFVSHNMAAIQSLCTKALHFNNGIIVGYGDVAPQIEDYLSYIKGAGEVSPNSNILVGSTIQINRFLFTPNTIESGKKVEFILQLLVDKLIRIDAITILIYSSLRILVGVIDLRHEKPYTMEALNPMTIHGKIKSLPLVEGEYEIGLYFSYDGKQDTLNDLININILSKPQQGTVTPYSPRVRGLVDLDVEFKIKEVEAL